MRLLGPWLVLTGAILAAPAQTNAPENRKLSLQECIQIALEHNLDIQIQWVNPDISRFTLDASYGVYDPTLNVSGGYTYSQSAGGIDAQGRLYAGAETEMEQASVSLQGLLPWGMNYNIGGSYSDTWGTLPTTVPDYSHPIVLTNSYLNLQNNQPVSFLTTNYNYIDARQPFTVFSGNASVASISQPLLKNLWIDNARLQILLNKKNLKTSELAFRNQVMTTVFSVEQAYYNLIFSVDNVKVQRKALELAERSLAENKKRVEVGAMAPLDEKQAESPVASSRASVLSAEGDLGTQQRLLKRLLSDDYSKWQAVSLEPAEVLVAVPQHLELQESWRKGLTLRPDLLQQKIALERQGFMVRFDKNQLFPDLELVGNVGYSGSAMDFSGVLDQERELQNPNWMVGGQMTVPLSRTTARNNYKSAKATERQIALQLKQLQQSILITLENDIATAQTSFQRVGATREATLYAEAALDAEQKKLESGKSTSFTVLQLQKNLTDAGSTEIRALADYNIALAQLYLDEGTILEHHHVSLKVKP
jgi:outer membrane protein TolC